MKFEKIHDKIKHKSFGKVTISDRKRTIHTEEKNAISQEAKAKELFELQKKKAEDAIEEIKKLKLSRVGNVWEVRKKVLGKKKTNTQPNAILNPESGILVVSKNEIKAVTLKYCKDTLENNQPHPKYQKEILMKKKVVEENCLKENCDFIINQETFDGIISKFRKSRKKSYDFLVKAGSLFQSVVFNFCQVIFSR